MDSDQLAQSLSDKIQNAYPYPCLRTVIKMLQGASEGASWSLIFTGSNTVPKINVLAVFIDPDSGESVPVRTKAGLRNVILTSSQVIKFVPIPVPSDPAHEAVRGFAYDMPVDAVVTVHSPTNRKWSAEVTRSGSHEFYVK